MAVRTFSATVTNKYELAGNWDTPPGAGDSIVIAANCLCDTDESGTVLAGVTVNANISLTMATGGHVKSQDVAIIQTAGTGGLVFDGGEFTHSTTGATAYAMTVNSITTTANGGTLHLPSAQAEKSNLVVSSDGSVSGFSAAVRLTIDGSGGASAGVVNLQFRSLLKWANVTGCARVMANYVCGAMVQGCLIHDWPAGGSGCGLYVNGRAFVRDSWVYNAGVNTTYGGMALRGIIYCTNVVFGKTEAGVPSSNVRDLISVGGTEGRVILHNCELASATPVEVHANSLVEVISTAHNKIKNSFMCWFGRGHTVETDAAGQSGAGLKFITVAAIDDTESERLRYLLAMIPATHGDQIDVTVWVKNAASKTCRLIIDPDSIFGTTQNQTGAVASADWEQRTIPAYTVNTTAGFKQTIPVCIDLYGASETWYADSMAVTITGAGENQSVSYEYVFDGVPVNEPVAAGGGLIVHPGMNGGFNG